MHIKNCSKIYFYDTFLVNDYFIELYIQGGIQICQMKTGHK